MAIIGQSGLYLLTILAVAPLLVNDSMAVAQTVSEMSRAARLTASAISPQLKKIFGVLCHSLRFSSVLIKILCIILTDPTGYLPPAVSPESITASAPSMTAFATSLASARVGLGFRIIESSIWVATMAGFPCERHFSMISFCTIGTSSVGISTPRSPLATIIPSTIARISSIFSTDCLVSIFAIIFASPECSSRIFLTPRISSFVLTKETAI